MPGGNRADPYAIIRFFRIDGFLFHPGTLITGHRSLISVVLDTGNEKLCDPVAGAPYYIAPVTWKGYSAGLGTSLVICTCTVFLPHEWLRGR